MTDNTDSSTSNVKTELSSLKISSSRNFQNRESGYSDLGGSLNNVLSVPLSDMSLLFAPTLSGFGTRLYNLKVDLKEV